LKTTPLSAIFTAKHCYNMAANYTKLDDLEWPWNFVELQMFIKLLMQQRF